MVQIDFTFFRASEDNGCNLPAVTKTTQVVLNDSNTAMRHCIRGKELVTIVPVAEFFAGEVEAGSCAVTLTITFPNSRSFFQTPLNETLIESRRYRMRNGDLDFIDVYKPNPGYAYHRVEQWLEAHSPKKNRQQQQQQQPPMQTLHLVAIEMGRKRKPRQ